MRTTSIFLKAIAVSLAILAVFAAPCLASDSDAPTPPAMLAAQELLARVQADQRVSPDAKNQLADRFDLIQVDFNTVFSRYKDAYQEGVDKRDSLNAEMQSLNDEIDLHNAKPHVFTLPDQQAQMDAYSAEEARLDEEGAQLIAKEAREMKPLEDALQDAAGDVDKWLSGPSLQEFNEVALALLSGEGQLKAGQTWDDAVHGVAQNAAPPGPQALDFDAPPAQPDGFNVVNLSNSHTDVVNMGVVSGHSSAPAALSFGPGAVRGSVSAYSSQLLQDLLRDAGLTGVTITSTQRSPSDQARAMFQNLRPARWKGETDSAYQARCAAAVTRQQGLYYAPGKAVISVFIKMCSAKNADGGPLYSAAQIQAAMAGEVEKQGPSNVSHHAADPNILNVIDIAPPTSPTDRAALEKALNQAVTSGRISKFLKPPADPAFHIEIPQPKP